MFQHYDKQKFALANCCGTLGRLCKFVLRCKNLYRIGFRLKIIYFELFRVDRLAEVVLCPINFMVIQLKALNKTSLSDTSQPTISSA